MSKNATTSSVSSLPWGKPEIALLRGRLAYWFAREARPLPWRSERSVYRTVVSEFMLQQTRVRTVLPYFERWMKRFPDFATLADAEESEVIRLWQGLGYYSRARNLHKLSKEWKARSQPPQTAAEWQSLPGVGPYTAAAISSISLKDPQAVVDGNVVRVLARLLDDAREWPRASSAVDAYRPIAQALLDPVEPGQHNEAVMELGALLCLPKAPLCTICPLYQFCGAGKKGGAESLPRITRSTKKLRTVRRAWVLQNGKVLLRIHPSGERLEGLKELPEMEQIPEDWQVQAQPMLSKKRGIGNESITEEIHWVEVANPLPPIIAPLIWVNESDLPHHSLSGPHRRWISELLRKS